MLVLLCSQLEFFAFFPFFREILLHRNRVLVNVWRGKKIGTQQWEPMLSNHMWYTLDTKPLFEVSIGHAVIPTLVSRRS